MPAPLARTSAEAHLYLELHGCDCGEQTFEPESAVVVLEDGELGQRYTYACPRCGKQHEVTFRLPPEPAPPGPVFTYGGPEPSELLDAAEWLAVADAYASQAPADVDALAPGDARRARALLTRAAAAVDEALKFEESDRLRAVRDTYAKLAAQSSNIIERSQ
ncbi:hypothetical protein [Symbioplanes lichenis]|uniref:hypothetical protein n=1 Tax=Symbioplanes lichenis TaxID=1629072 RepID=UPI0027395557|nr:hypothetical protein [Actinoplanes lichenis]